MHDTFVTDISESIGARKITDLPRITVLIPRGEVIRNLLYSGTLDYLNHNAEISVISVEPSPTITKHVSNNCREFHSLKEIPESRIVEFQRELIDMAHCRWLWSHAARHRWKVHDQLAKTPRQKAIRLMKKAVSIPLATRSGLRALSRVERASSYFLKTNGYYLDLLRRLQPKIVFNGSHVHSHNAIQAVQAAQWLGIKTATFIFSWDNLTSQGRVLLPYDYYLVWGEDLKSQLLDMYEWIDPSQVFITGTPQFDFHFRDEFYQTREEFCRLIGADPKRPIVLYTTGMANHMPGEPEIVEEIADMLAKRESVYMPQLLVRVYPKDLTGRFEELKNRRKDILFAKVAWETNWLTPQKEDSVALVNTIRHCAVGINVASTVSLELCMFDKPAINVGYNPLSVDANVLSYAKYYEFDHYQPVVNSGAVEVAWDRAQMQTLIKLALSEPDRLAEKRSNLVSKMFGATLDGYSGRRIANALLAICLKQNDGN